MLQRPERLDAQIPEVLRPQPGSASAQLSAEPGQAGQGRAEGFTSFESYDA